MVSLVRNRVELIALEGFLEATGEENWVAYRQFWKFMRFESWSIGTGGFGSGIALLHGRYRSGKRTRYGEG